MGELGSIEVRHLMMTDIKPFEDNPRTIGGKALTGLEKSIRRFGLVEPIVWNERTGNIVGGHQRLRALKLLGKKTVRCRIRYDLADAAEHEIVQYLIRDNLHRRQLTKLERARLYRELLALERNGDSRNGDLKGDLRDHLAKQFAAGITE